MAGTPELPDRELCKQDDFDNNSEKYREEVDGVIHCLASFPLVLNICHRRFLVEAPDGPDGDLQRSDIASPAGCLKAKLGEWATRRIKEEYL